MEWRSETISDRHCCRHRSNQLAMFTTSTRNAHRSKKKKRNRDRRMEESDKMSIDLVDDGEDETYSRPKSSIWDGC